MFVEIPVWRIEFIGAKGRSSIGYVCGRNPDEALELFAAEPIEIYQINRVMRTKYANCVETDE